MKTQTLSLLFGAEGKIILKLSFLFQIQIFIVFVKVNNKMNYFGFTLPLEHSGSSFCIVHCFCLRRFLLNFDCVRQFSLILRYLVDVVGGAFVADLFFHFLQALHERTLLINEGIILLTVLWLDIWSFRRGIAQEGVDGKIKPVVVLGLRANEWEVDIFVLSSWIIHYFFFIITNYYLPKSIKPVIL